MNGSSYPRKRAPAAAFVATTIVLFFFSLSTAESIGFVPCYVDATCSSSEAADTVALSSLPELGPEEQALGNRQQAIESGSPVVSVEPERIVISAIDLDLPVQNPETRDIAKLDELLKDGPVRYVDSAKLGEKGNVLIFAHTSHLPVVHNQMYKAFNRIPELKAGDSITVSGEGKNFLYTVRSVRSADANEDVIDLSPTLGQKLTLVTCDTLTGKSARFILEADFVAAF